MKLTANCVRYEGWWVVRVPETPGLFTQVRRLDQAADMVLDAAHMLDDQPEEGFEVEVVPQLDDQTRGAIDDSRNALIRLQQATETAARANRAAADLLRSQGLTVRDIAAIMGVSQQRVSQLLTGTRASA